MKILSYFLFLFFLSVVSYVFFSLIHLVFVHVKAYVIRRKLSKLEETEKKDD